MYSLILGDTCKFLEARIWGKWKCTFESMWKRACVLEHKLQGICIFENICPAQVYVHCTMYSVLLEKISFGQTVTLSIDSNQVVMDCLTYVHNKQTQYFYWFRYTCFNRCTMNITKMNRNITISTLTSYNSDSAHPSTFNF